MLYYSHGDDHSTLRRYPGMGTSWRRAREDEKIRRYRQEDEFVRAMILERPGEPLRAADVAVPEPEEGQVQLRVHACAVCRTDLHIVDGELPDPRLPRFWATRSSAPWRSSAETWAV